MDGQCARLDFMSLVSEYLGGFVIYIRLRDVFHRIILRQLRGVVADARAGTPRRAECLVGRRPSFHRE